jgi:hypothetical protein
MQPPRISISIVSHNQSGLVHELLKDLKALGQDIEVILTINVPEVLPFRIEDFGFPVRLIKNREPKGFGANHNQAYAQASGAFFCVLNPDIRINRDPFQRLMGCLQDEEVGVVAPKIVNADDDVEDSARRFPTPSGILMKVLRIRRAKADYLLNDGVTYPDWVGGMFMLFRSEVFRSVGGFDERYFLYYEDVDLCARLRLQKYEVAVCPDVTAVHNARRQSHRSLKYLTWHMVSMARFFFSPVFVKVVWLRR